MDNKEMIAAMLDDVELGNGADAQNKFNELIAQRVTSALDAAKTDYATGVYGDASNAEQESES